MNNGPTCPKIGRTSNSSSGHATGQRRTADLWPGPSTCTLGSQGLTDWECADRGGDFAQEGQRGRVLVSGVGLVVLHRCGRVLI